MGVETRSSAGLVERISKVSDGLSLRKRESTSLARTMAFNPHKLKLFFNNLKTLYNHPEVSLEMIWNLDETGVNTADIFYVHWMSMYIAQTLVAEVENLKICKLLLGFCGVFFTSFYKICEFIFLVYT